MSYNIDLGGTDLFVNTIHTGATVPGATGTLLNNVNDGIVVSTLTGINFNSATTDNAITISLPAGFTRYAVDSMTITNASHTLVTATLGLNTATGGSGTVIADSAITVTSNTNATANNYQAFSGPATTVYSATTNATLQVRVGTAEGAAATGDVTVRVKPLP